MRHSNHGIRSEAEAQVHPVIARVALDVVGEPCRGDGSGGDSESVFEFPTVLGDTRRTAVSTADAEDDGVTLISHFGPELRVVQKHVALFALELRFHGRHVARKPLA